MKRNSWYIPFTCALALTLTSTNAFAAGWQKGTGANADRWYYDKGNGIRETNTWQWLDGNGDGIAECYCFDGDGWMYANVTTPDGYEVNGDGAWTINGAVQIKDANGIFVADGEWKQENGWWYYQNNDGTRRANGWYWLDGNHDGEYECYYFDEYGWLLTDTFTPDFYFVNSDGAWVEDGIVQVRPLKRNRQKHRDEVNKDRDYTTFYDDADEEEIDYEMIPSYVRKKVEEKIAEFKDTYIHKGMSDFEKEVEIVKWLVKNCTYDETGQGSGAAAYDCIVKGTAVCEGYAKAFLETAKACGLNAKYVSSEDHGWNLVELDGDWYHVDVTWEDSGDGLDGSALFFNLRDDQVRQLAHHETWSPSNIKANGTKYGSGVVANYLKTGEIDTSIKGGEAEDFYQFGKDVQDNIGGRIIWYTNMEDTINELTGYIEERVAQGCDNYEYTLRFDEKHRASETEQSEEISELCHDIYREAQWNVYAKYEEICEFTMMSTFLGLDENSRFYQHAKGDIKYLKGAPQ